LDDFENDGEVQGLFAAYFCPINEIQDEGNILIDTIEGWGIPKTSPKKLRDLFSKKLQNAADNPHDARGALYSILAEADAWRDFIDDYEKSMLNYSRLNPLGSFELEGSCPEIRRFGDFLRN
jgi:hypothetical protein